MKDVAVAGRYAQALFLLSERQAKAAGAPLVERLDAVLADLRAAATLLAPGTTLGGFLANPLVAPLDRRRVLRSGLHGRALPVVEEFADLLLRKKRLDLVARVAHEFQVLVERVKGLQRARVVSAVPLTEAERRRLHARLEEATGKKIVLDTALDPGLLGGAYVRIGDRVVDRSVRSLLEAIAKQLYEVSV
ncbi:MAG TPA: ATP synthase F1 subunit delta [Candidatus Eisenbacteria bacterium]|nr:ATP synthase F1 subunit delta [Candidatus Eisenbacteria bacterium]